jgi:ankyrin repeat protein
VNNRERVGLGVGGITYPLLMAVKKGHKGIVELLLNEGAEINTRGDFEETALHLAARAGHKEVVQLLISEGAIINLKDSYLSTPVDYAEGISRHNKLNISSELKKIN